MKGQELETEITNLVKFTEKLREAIDEMSHEIRRCSDALERHGGRSAEYELKMRTLQKNVRLNIAELEKAQNRVRLLQDKQRE